MSIRRALLVSLLAGCATTHAAVESTVARSEAPGGCAGIEVELVVREDASGHELVRRIVMHCEAHGATLTYETYSPGIEDGRDQIQLDEEGAAALWAELNGVSSATLDCGHTGGVRSHRLTITSPHTSRVLSCEAAETPIQWSRLGAILWPERPSTDEEAAWPFEASWSDEQAAPTDAPSGG